ncbi:MAG: 3-deoxy-D-manno-octulosonic acid transferase [Bacteroidales bacterium]|nr:3-deoxy-D-manno-octulosonic acid transferase [Bacteroidales bacterium]
MAWFHTASLGEFEQGRPLIEGFRKKYPNFKIFLTFFSPSGYEIRKNYSVADYIFYLPLDTPKNAKKFVEIVDPQIVFFVKYEFWYNFLRVLKSKGKTVFIVSGIFRKEQHFFKWYGSWFRKILKLITFFFVQNQESKELLNKIGIENVEISGDTRFDRVFEISQNKKSFPLIETFKHNSDIFLGGSTWPADEELIYSLINKKTENLKFIIAPHEVHKERIKLLKEKFLKDVLLFSDVLSGQVEKEEIKNSKILIIDSIGILSHLYHYSKFAYIGGGFGVGIHNILEAVTFGKPVFFGPNYKKFQEANDLINLGVAFCVHNDSELIENVKAFSANIEKYNKCSKSCSNYILDKKGATEIILKMTESRL